MPADDDSITVASTARSTESDYTINDVDRDFRHASDLRRANTEESHAEACGIYKHILDNYNGPWPVNNAANGHMLQSIHYNYGMSLSVVGDYDGAVTELSTAKSLGNTHAQEEITRLDKWQNILAIATAQSQLSAEWDEQTLATYKEVLAIVPNHFGAMEHAIGIITKQTTPSAYIAAAAILTTANKLTWYDSKVHEERYVALAASIGTKLLESGEYEKALLVYQTSAKNFPDNTIIQGKHKAVIDVVRGKAGELYTKYIPLANNKSDKYAPEEALPPLSEVLTLYRLIERFSSLTAKDKGEALLLERRVIPGLRADVRSRQEAAEAARKAAEQEAARLAAAEVARARAEQERTQREAVERQAAAEVARKLAEEAARLAAADTARKKAAQEAAQVEAAAQAERTRTEEAARQAEAQARSRLAEEHRRAAEEAAREAEARDAAARAENATRQRKEDAAARSRAAQAAALELAAAAERRRAEDAARQAEIQAATEREQVHFTDTLLNASRAFSRKHGIINSEATNSTQVTTLVLAAVKRHWTEIKPNIDGLMASELPRSIGGALKQEKKKTSGDIFPSHKGAVIFTKEFLSEERGVTVAAKLDFFITSALPPKRESTLTAALAPSVSPSAPAAKSIDDRPPSPTAISPSPSAPATIRMMAGAGLISRPPSPRSYEGLTSSQSTTLDDLVATAVHNIVQGCDSPDSARAILGNIGNRVAMATFLMENTAVRDSVQQPLSDLTSIYQLTDTHKRAMARLGPQPDLVAWQAAVSEAISSCAAQSIAERQAGRVYPTLPPPTVLHTTLPPQGYTPPRTERRAPPPVGRRGAPGLSAALVAGAGTGHPPATINPGR